MIDEVFCSLLEYGITYALKENPQEDAKGFWCDGVLLNGPDYHYQPQYIEENKVVKMQCYMGRDGQTLFELIIRFGPWALRGLLDNENITECIPQADAAKWLMVDVEKRVVEVQLY